MVQVIMVTSHHPLNGQIFIKITDITYVKGTVSISVNVDEAIIIQLVTCGKIIAKCCENGHSKNAHNFVCNLIFIFSLT